MKHPYLTRQVLTDLAASLTDRDDVVLASLDRIRVATSLQLERLHFTDVSRRQARQLLAGMVRRRLLARLPRVVGGARAGSAGYVYTLDVAGARIVTGARQRRPWSVGAAFLAHSLAVTELYVRLVEAARTDALVMSSFTTEPRCWRRFSGPGGARVTLKPDAHLVVEVDGYADRWFVEVDCDTESTTTLARKCETYRRYWQTGIEQQHTEVFPRVLWLVPDAKRYQTLVDVCGRQPAEAWPLFAVALSSEAVTRIAQGADV